MPLVRTLPRLQKLAAALAVASLALVAHAQSFGPAHVKPMLAAATRGAPPGGTLTVALVETIETPASRPASPGRCRRAGAPATSSGPRPAGCRSVPS